jgi:hypothetical protein
MSITVGKFVSVNEAAGILGCTDGRIRQMLRGGTLPGLKLNQRAWALLRKDVERASKKHPQTGRPRISKKSA